MAMKNQFRENSHKRHYIYINYGIFIGYICFRLGSIFEKKSACNVVKFSQLGRGICYVYTEMHLLEVQIWIKYLICDTILTVF